MTVLNFKEPVSIELLGLGDYIVQYYHPTLDPDRKIWDISHAISELSWKYDLNEAALEVTLTLSYDAQLKSIVRPGGIVTIFGRKLKPDGTTNFDELFRVVVFEKNLSTVDNDAIVTVTCYDHMIYFTKNSITQKYLPQRASALARSICHDFGVDIGQIDETKYIIPVLVFRKQTLYDIMVTALSEDRWITAERWIQRFDKGKYNLFKKVIPPDVWFFQYGFNIYQASYDESIKDMKNKILLYQPTSAAGIAGQVAEAGALQFNDGLVLVAGGPGNPVQDDQKIADYGLMQDVETGLIPLRFLGVAMEYAKNRLFWLSRVIYRGKLQAPNINTLRAGDAIYIKDPISGLAAQYYIISGTHTVTPENAVMELIVQFEDLMPELYYEDEGFGGDVVTKIVEDAGITARRRAILFGTRAQIGESPTSPPLADPYIIYQEYGANAGTGYNGTGGHTGIDMGNGHGEETRGKPVYAVADGVIVQQGQPDSLSGNRVDIDHAQFGYRSIYAHLDTFIVGEAVGTVVKRGDVIGTVGDSGSAKQSAQNPAGGPHLHFEVKRMDVGVVVSPRELVDIHS